MHAVECAKRGRRRSGKGEGRRQNWEEEVVTFSEGEGRFMIVESDIGREIFHFIAFARNKRKISDSYKRGY